MKNFKEKFLSPVSFGIIIICFFFPFIEIKCNDVKLATVSGIDLVTGSSVKLQDLKLPPTVKDESKQHILNLNDQPIDRNYFAIAALLFAAGGLVLSLLMTFSKEIFTGIIGFAGLLSLLLLRIQVDNSIEKSTEGLSAYLVHVEYEFGYWLSIAFFLLAGAVNLFSFMEEERAKI